MSLELSAGHIYGLLGKNGEGKSTLLKLISGMIFAQGGKVEALGTLPTKREPSFLSQIYYITEEIYSPGYSIRRYLKNIAPFYPNFSQSDFDNYVKEFELDCSQKISSMSLGQKKKFAIAFGLATNSRLLIMDEPTNGLDIPSKSQFRKIVSGLATDQRCIIISTHQVRDLDNLIDSVVILDQGDIILNSSIEKISQKLSFKTITSDDKPIYEEGNTVSRWGVVENRDGEMGKVDIEILFNAAISSGSEIKKILKEEDYE